MNAVSFGALIPKPAVSTFVYKTADKLNTFLFNNYNLVRRVQQIGGSTFEVELHDFDDKATLCKWGAMVLSYSKFLMDRLLGCLSEIGAPARYTDTDSVVFPRSALAQVCELFEAKYGIVFMGEDMMQFHSEFELETPDGKTIPEHLVNAVRSYYIGRKLYFHRLEAKVGDKVHIGYKMSAKGFTKRGLEHYALRLTDNSMDFSTQNVAEGLERLYKGVSEGEEHEVPLYPLGVGAPQFTFEYGVGVSTKPTGFHRKFRNTRKDANRVREAQEEEDAAFGALVDEG